MGVNKMKVHTLFLFLLATFSVHEFVCAEQSAVIRPEQVVGEVYGKPITAGEIGLTAPVDTELEFDARNSQQWQAMGQIARVFSKPVMDRFVKERNVAAAEQEIADYKANFRRMREKHLEETEGRLSELKEKLKSTDLTTEETAKLKKEQKMLDFILPRLRDASTSEAPDELARMFIVARKTEQELHKTFGGRVIFQQARPEALDARRKLFEQAEEKGDLKFNDPGVRHLFYYYSKNMKHVVVDDALLEQSGWGLENNSQQSARVRPQPPIVNVPATLSPATQAEQSWNFVPSSVESLRIASTRIVPVESGIWFNGRHKEDTSLLGYFDLTEGRVTLVVKNTSINWDAIGNEVIAVQLDQKSLVRMDAEDQSVGTWEYRPPEGQHFSQVLAFDNHFCIAAYQPLWVFDRWLKTWESIELKPVTDSDSSRLGEEYYRPTMHRVVISPDGKFWGFQGTFDAMRGNAVCHYDPETAKWEHYDFPWAPNRGDDHWAIGVTDTTVFFAGQQGLLLFDKVTHRWSVPELEWPEGSPRNARFTPHGVLIPVGNTVKRLSSDMSAWEDVLSLDAGAEIKAIAATEDALYVATISEFHIAKAIDTNLFAEPVTHPLKFADDVKVYEAVLGYDEPNESMELADKFCEAAENGNLDQVKRLLAEGVNIEATTDPSGSTPLMLACSAGHADVAKLLLENGADLHARNKMRHNALTIAAEGRHYELADYLMSKGASR
jgi:hypothetical protein